MDAAAVVADSVAAAAVVEASHQPRHRAADSRHPLKADEAALAAVVNSTMCTESAALAKAVGHNLQLWACTRQSANIRGILADLP